ncbi:hypothetical protein ASE59_13115 [Sphingomonas sp. Leaf10]|nr:hypothetical protein ASE59_13115 [Sphingomonas sp. Leaf10]
MFDHQLDEARAVDQDHALRHVADEVDRRGAEAGGGDEHALGRAEADRAADEALHVRPPDPDMRGIIAQSKAAMQGSGARKI